MGVQYYGYPPHVRPKACARVFIFCPKGNSMFLNTFLFLFWYYNHFSCSQGQEIKFLLQIIAQNILKLSFFGDFLQSIFHFLSLSARKIVVITKEYCKRVQKHRMTFGTKFKDPSTRIGSHMAGNCKKCARKDQNSTFSALFGGVVQRLYRSHQP